MTDFTSTEHKKLTIYRNLDAVMYDQYGDSESFDSLIDAIHTVTAEGYHSFTLNNESSGGEDIWTADLNKDQEPFDASLCYNVSVHSNPKDRGLIWARFSFSYSTKYVIETFNSFAQFFGFVERHHLKLAGWTPHMTKNGIIISSAIIPD